MLLDLAEERLQAPRDDATPTKYDPGHRERARNVHQTFLTEYGLTAEQVPMLMYDKSRCACYDRTSGCSCEGPFVLFEGG